MPDGSIIMVVIVHLSFTRRHFCHSPDDSSIIQPLARRQDCFFFFISITRCPYRLIHNPPDDTTNSFFPTWQNFYFSLYDKILYKSLFWCHYQFITHSPRDTLISIISSFIRWQYNIKSFLWGFCLCYLCKMVNRLIL